MWTKICSKCKQEKPVTDFRLKGKDLRGKRHTYCILCQNQYLRDRYKDNKDKFAKSAKDYSKVMRDYWKSLIDKIKDVPCMDCGGKFPPICMDFDHRDSTSKIASVSILRCTLKSKKHEKLILDEIAKCDIVCANCHRIRTQNRGYELRFKPSEEYHRYTEDSPK